MFLDFCLRLIIFWFLELVFNLDDDRKWWSSDFLTAFQFWKLKLTKLILTKIMHKSFTGVSIWLPQLKYVNYINKFNSQLSVYEKPWNNSKFHRSNSLHRKIWIFWELIRCVKQPEIFPSSIAWIACEEKLQLSANWFALWNNRNFFKVSL